MLGTVHLITFLGRWNNFIMPQTILRSLDIVPLSVARHQLHRLYRTDYDLIMAGTFGCIAPVLLLFLLLQKEFFAGLTTGAVKG